MTDRDPSAADPFGQIADEFVDAFRQGKRPSVEEFARRYPDHAAEIHELLPALVLMEKAKAAPGSTGEPGPAPPPAGPAPVGQLAEYQLLREIGRGGMGVVYEAQQLSLGRHVAIKVLPRHALLDPKQLGRFQREARAAARLHHTNIVPVYGVGEQDGVHFYVMQFIQGLGLDLVLDELRRLRGKTPPPPVGAAAPGPDAAATVSAVVAARSLLSGYRASAPTGSYTPAAPAQADASASARLPGRGDPTPLSDSGRQYWQGVARVGMQVADALAHAASQGVLHRDIKPSNLLLDDTGNVWVTDFGLAKDETADDDLTNTGDVIGTLRYMAPERFQGRADLRSDIYSLGLTLYEMLVLRPAFGGADRKALVKAVLDDDPVPPRALDRAVPRDIETVVLKAIARDPDQRYQTPAEMADDLKRFVEDQPVRARRISSAERVWRSCRRNPLVAGLLTGIVVVFLAGFAGVSWQWFEAGRARAAAEHERDAARWREYRANMAAVASALSLNNMTEARRLLEASHPDHRGWEWRHFMTRLDGARAVLRHDAPVWYVSYNRDGTRLATSSKDGRLRVWDTATGRELFQKHLADQKGAGRYGMIELLPDDRVVFVGAGGTSRIWQPLAPSTPDVVTPVEGRYIPKLSPGRAYAAWSSLSGGKAWLWDVRNGRAPVRLPDTPVSAVAFGRDDRLLAMTVEGNEIVIWDLARGAVVQRFGRNPVWHNFLAVHPRADLVVAASLHPECELRLWTVGGELIRRQAVHRNTVTSLAFSPDGSRLASSSLDQTIGLWHGNTLQPVTLLRGHTGKVIQVLFSPDGTRLVSMSEDLSLRVWDAAGGEPVAVLQGHTELVNWIAVSPSGDTIASAANDGTVRLWDPEPRNTLRGHTKYVYDVCFSPDGARLASAAWDGTVRLWDATTHKALTPPLEQETGPARVVQSVAWSRDGGLLAVAARDRFVHIWDAKEGKKLRTLDVATSHWKADIRAAFNPDASLLATGSDEGLVRLWNPTTGEKLAEWDGRHGISADDAFTSDVAFSPDGRLLATAGADNLLRLWRVSDVLAGRTAEPHAALAGHTEIIHRLVWGKDGTWLASSSEDRTVRLWSVEGAKELACLPHGSIVYGLALSPDGTRLASGCADNTIRIWDVAKGEPVAELRGHDAYVKSVAFSPDGERLVSASGDHTLRVWDTVSVRERVRRTAASRRP
ncbi:MAG TPA: protein kinase [Urbifossiella sp.]|jgi:WD40 repeat protein/serine/threonine protein kinase|nr:protein kinase [Urbifossiella sp.]